MKNSQSKQICRISATIRFGAIFKISKFQNQPMNEIQANSILKSSRTCWFWKSTFYQDVAGGRPWSRWNSTSLFPLKLNNFWNNQRVTLIKLPRVFEAGVDKLSKFQFYSFYSLVEIKSESYWIKRWSLNLFKLNK